MTPTLCPTCLGSGVIHFESHPYGHGWGTVTETIPCSCRPVAAPVEYEERAWRQAIAAEVEKAEAYLAKRSDLEAVVDPKSGLIEWLARDDWRTRK